jgi:predicted amidohydrolase
MSGDPRIAAVPFDNRIPGDSFDHHEVMVAQGRVAATLVDRMCAQYPSLELVCLPVLALTGSGAGRRMLKLLPTTPLDARQLAVDVTNPDDRLQPLFDVCQSRGVMVSTSAIECHPLLPTYLFHTGFVIGPNGVVLRSPKVLARSGPSITLTGGIRDEYEAVFGAESLMPVVQTSVGRLACVVEGEIEFDELAEVLIDRQVDVVCNPTLRTGEHPAEAADGLLERRASETNSLWVSTCATGEYVDDNEGQWVYAPFADGTSMWTAKGRYGHAPSGEVLLFPSAK